MRQPGLPGQNNEYLALLDHVAAQLKPLLGRTSPDVRATQPAFEVIRNRVETPAVDGEPAGLCITEGVVEPAGRAALRRHRVELRQPMVVDRTCRLDKPLAPRDGVPPLNP